MRKTISRLIPLIVLSLSLQSCRTNDEAISSKDEAYYSNKFQVFSQPVDGKIDYPNGFAFLLKEYDRIHSSNFTGLRISKNNFSLQKGDIAEKHVDFRISSQPIKLYNGETWVFFPVVESGAVTGIIVGVLRNEETFVEFGTLNPNEEYNQMVLEKFRSAYLSKKTLSSRKGGDDETAPCIGSEGDPCGIEEISIPPPSGPYLPTIDVGVYPGQGGGSGGGTPPPSGDCSIYNNCGTPEPKDPCEKTKAMLESQKNKAITDDLKNHIANGTGEKGWRDNKTGDPTPTTQNGDHSVNFGDPSTMNGAYHNHTGTKVDIFSATDIATLVEIARYQNVGSAGNGYVGIMAPGGIHYVIYFNGGYVDYPLSAYNELDLLAWDTQQLILMYGLMKNNSFVSGQGTLNFKGLEQIFFATLEKMGLQNKVTLQKIEDTNPSTVIQNTDGTTTDIPCNN